MLQSPGVHLQATDQVVHVRLTGLVVQVTVSKEKCISLIYHLIIMLENDAAGMIHSNEQDYIHYVAKNMWKSLVLVPAVII